MQEDWNCRAKVTNSVRKNFVTAINDNCASEFNSARNALVQIEMRMEN